MLLLLPKTCLAQPPTHSQSCPWRTSSCTAPHVPPPTRPSPPTSSCPSAKHGNRHPTSSARGRSRARGPSRRRSRPRRRNGKAPRAAAWGRAPRPRGRSGRAGPLAVATTRLVATAGAGVEHLAATPKRLGVGRGRAGLLPHGGPGPRGRRRPPGALAKARLAGGLVLVLVLLCWYCWDGGTEGRRGEWERMCGA